MRMNCEPRGWSQKKRWQLDLLSEKMLTVVNVIQWQNKSKILKASPQYWCYYSYLTFFIIVKNCDTLPLLINWNIFRLLKHNSSDDENLLHTTRDTKSCEIHQHGKIKHITNCLKKTAFSPKWLAKGSRVPLFYLLWRLFAASLALVGLVQASTPSHCGILKFS